MDLVNKTTFDLELDSEKKTLVIIDNKKLPAYDDLYKIEKKEDIDKLEMLNLISSKLVVDIILDDEDFLNNFSLVILNLTFNLNLYNNIFLNIYREKLKKSYLLPKLKLYNYTENIEIFTLNVKNIEFEKDYKDIKTEYLKEDILLEEKFKIVKETLKSDKYLGEIVLIFVDDKEEVYKHFMEKDFRVINFSRNEKLDSRSVKKNILILDEITPLNYENIKTVFDLSIMSKEIPELLKNYIRKSGVIHRLNTKENLDKLPIFNQPDFDRDSLYKYYIKILNNSHYNPDSILDRYPVIETFNELKNLGIVDKNRLLINGELLLKIPLDFRPSLVIYYLIQYHSELPLYPFIVLASVINKKLEHSAILKFFEIWDSFINTFLNLEVDKEDIEEWLETKDFDSKIFIELLNKIKEVYYALYFDYKIELGKFYIEDLMPKAVDILIKAYKENVYKLKDRSEYFYSNGKKLVKLEKELVDKYPETIISFREKEDKIVSYLSLL